MRTASGRGHRGRVSAASLALGLGMLLGSAPVAKPRTPSRPIPEARPVAAPVQAPGETAAPDLDDFPRLRPGDLPGRYEEWIEHEVRWIITGLERDVFLRLDTDEKRDRFISEFWRRRDPTPGTPKNEFHDVHVERLAYADRFFGRRSPRRGSLTDMGRIHILLGEPQTRNVLDTSTVVHPTEVWFYAVDARLGVPPFFYVVFFQEQGVGEFELYSPIADGPKALLNPSGLDFVERRSRQRGAAVGLLANPEVRAIKEALQRNHGDLAQAAFSLIPGEGTDRPTLRSEFLLGDLLSIPERLMDRPEWAYAVLAGTVESAVRFETLSIDAGAIGMVAADGSSFIAYYVGTPSQGLNWTAHEEETYLTFGVSTSLSRGTAVLESAPTRFIESPMTPEMARASRREALYFVDRVPAIPGSLALDVLLENNVTGRFGSSTVSVTVPGAHPANVGLGMPVLSVDVQDQPDRPFAPQFPFQVGATAFMPAVTGELHVAAELLVFHQVFVPADHGDLVHVVYRVLDETGALRSRKQVALRPDLADRFGVINQTTEIGLDGLAPGRYELAVSLAEEPDSGHALSFRLAEQPAEPILHAERRPAPADVRVVLHRAAQYRAAGILDEAERLLDDVVTRLPESREAEALMIDVLLAADRTERLIAFLEPRLVQRPNDRSLLRFMAEATARAGRHEDAARYYERLRLVGGDEPRILNALASEYRALGEPERMRELLRLSLQADPDQPRIRELLDLVEQQPAPDQRR